MYIHRILNKNMFLFLSVILMLNQYGKIIIKIDEFYTINLHLHRLKKKCSFYQ